MPKLLALLLSPKYRYLTLVGALISLGFLSMLFEKPKPAPAPVAQSPTAKPSPVNCPKGEEWGDWQKAGGNMWADVQLYIGDGACKKAIATIIGGNSQRVLLKYASGPDWKNRSAVADELYVKKDDPAIAAMKWRDIPN